MERGDGMSWHSGVTERVRALLFRTREEREMDEEMRFHMEMHAAENVRRGMAPEAAARAARLEFGWAEVHKDAVRRARGTRWVEDVGADLRHGARLLRRSPGFTAVVVLTLALGIGANAAVFSVVNGVLLRPLPFAESDRLVIVRGGMGVRGEFLQVRERARALEGVAAYSAHEEASLTGEGEPARLATARVTPELLPLLGVGPMLGRGFAAEESERGRERVVLLSHALWRQRYGGDPGVLGRSLVLDGESHTVVGVMPPGFRFPEAETQLWRPVVLGGSPPQQPGELWGEGGYVPLGRLAPGATPEQARAELAALGPGMRELVPWQMPEDYWREPAVTPLREEVAGAVRPMLLVLLGAVGLVLLIACVNVANLLLARAAARRQEVAVRSALGAGRGRILRQLLTESVLLTLVGGAAGVLLALGGVRLLVAMLPNLPRVVEVGIDARVLLFALGLSLLTGVLFGLAPALRSAGSGMREGLREGGRAGVGRERQRLARVLVTTQVALAVVLVAGAGLMVRSLWELLRVDPGFQPGNVVAASVSPPDFRYPDTARRQAYHDELLARLARVPGARAAALASGVPFAGDVYGSVFIIDGRPDPSREGGDWPWADGRVSITPDYFRTLSVPVVRGRAFTDADRADAPHVVVVSQALATRYWPDADPVGARVRFPADRDWRTVVGIAGDVQWADLAAERGTGLYVPLQQGWGGAVRAVVRSTADPDAVTRSIRSIVAGLDPDTPVSDMRTMEQLVTASVAGPRSAMVLLAVFAALALALGAVGIYGVTAYAVAQRRQEFGIRMALGARAGDVVRLVLRQGAILTAAGIIAGLAIALMGTRVLSGMLYGISATDPLTFAVVPIVLALVALAAISLPARRAARVDPNIAMRGD
jgi:putative ABC transport system permease protein